MKNARVSANRRQDVVDGAFDLASRLAYATMLKNVGSLYQTLYLAGTAMNLATCAIGTGDADSFSRLIGRDPLEETSVGEFIVGSAPDAGRRR